jgi:hypothetical protein
VRHVWNFVARLLCCAEEIIHKVAIFGLGFSLAVSNLSRCIRKCVLSQELHDLFNIGASKVLTGAELVRHFQIISSIVARQFTEDAITQIHIDDLVILTCREKLISRILNSCTDTSSPALSCLLSSLSRVLDFSNFIPFPLSITPHVSECDAILSENLHKSIGFAAHFSLNFVFEIR